MLPAQRAANAARSSHKEGGFGASVRHSIATAAPPKPSAAPGGGSDHIVNRTTSAGAAPESGKQARPESARQRSAAPANTFFPATRIRAIAGEGDACLLLYSNEAQGGKRIQFAPATTGASHLCRACPAFGAEAALSRRRNKLLGCTAKRCCTPKPVGAMGACLEREASRSAARQRRFVPQTGAVAQPEEFCLTPKNQIWILTCLTPPLRSPILESLFA